MHGQAVLHDWCMHIACQFVLRRLSPLSDSTLEGAQLPVREDAREFVLEACKKIAPDAIGLGLEPRAHNGPGGLKRILARPPITRGARRETMRGADFAVLPRGGQARQEFVEAAVLARCQVRRLAGGQSGQVALDRPNLLQEP